MVLWTGSGWSQRGDEVSAFLLPPRAQTGFSAAILGGSGEAREALSGGCGSKKGAGRGPKPETRPSCFTLRRMWGKPRKGGPEGYACAHVWAEIPEAVKESTETLPGGAVPPE